MIVLEMNLSTSIDSAGNAFFFGSCSRLGEIKDKSQIRMNVVLWKPYLVMKLAQSSWLDRRDSVGIFPIAVA